MVSMGRAVAAEGSPYASSVDSVEQSWNRRISDTRNRGEGRERCFSSSAGARNSSR